MPNNLTYLKYAEQKSNLPFQFFIITVILLLYIEDVYERKHNAICSPHYRMSSKNLSDAKQECDRLSNCTMFNDICSHGYHFRYCIKGAKIKPSQCANRPTTLYTKDIEEGKQ